MAAHPFVDRSAYRSVVTGDFLLTDRHGRVVCLVLKGAYPPWARAHAAAPGPPAGGGEAFGAGGVGTEVSRGREKGETATNPPCGLRSQGKIFPGTMFRALCARLLAL